MSSEDWRIEFEKLNDIPVLEGELEWVSRVVSEELASKQQQDQEHNSEDDAQE